ncbi:MAG: tRNA 5-methoxyuridine(34)/uridine 5-oxyacetic acid(34) synthase CmoB [Pseudomonadota bacterium]
MIPVEALRQRWIDNELASWADLLPAQVEAGLCEKRYGDLPRWKNALKSMPEVPDVSSLLDQDTVTLACPRNLDTDASAKLQAALQGLHPWRKGPFDFFGTFVNTEWRSDWKWQRLSKLIEPLHGRRVLDVGCGNGYHCWRMRGAGAAEVIGIDPSPLFVTQFYAVQQYVRDDMVCVLPSSFEQMPADLRAFDTVFSMGVLYHRQDPIAHLQRLKKSLRKSGELILETLVISGDKDQCLVPESRYARMGNVWFIPTSDMLLIWLKKLGWREPRLVDETPTSTEEQRSTEWMRFHSLQEFLDPADHTLTIEGYPAPRRAIFLATAP